MYIETTRDDHRVAWLTALAISLHIAESAVPSPLPGLKPGLANIITVIVLIQFGWRLAAWVNLLRVVAGSLLIGTFLSPTFLLSFSGALAATITFSVLSQLPGQGCGPIGYSIAAAMSHMAAQFWIAYILFIRHDALFHLLPLLMTAALIFGILNGVIALALLRQLPPHLDLAQRVD